MADIFHLIGPFMWNFCISANIRVVLDFYFAYRSAQDKSKSSQIIWFLAR